MVNILPLYEQVRRAVPHVVMGALLGLPEVDRQHRLRPVQRLHPRAVYKWLDRRASLEALNFVDPLR